jgi:hypothetical protein
MALNLNHEFLTLIFKCFDFDNKVFYWRAPSPFRFAATPDVGLSTLRSRRYNEFQVDGLVEKLVRRRVKVVYRAPTSTNQRRRRWGSLGFNDYDSHIEPGSNFASLVGISER